MGVRNWFKKSSKTFDREGFYIILFICLCIVAVTAVYVSRNNANTAKKAEGQKNVQQKEPVDKTDLVKDNTSSEYDKFYSNKDVSTNKDPKTVSAVNPPDKSNSTSSITKTSPTAKPESSTTASITLSMPVEGKINKNFSKDELQYSQTMQQWETHEGIDILCDIGTDVKAAQAGKVVNVITDDNSVESLEKTGFGVSVVIEHSNGMRTVYSNLDNELKVKKGDTVKKGQVLGIVGDTAVRETSSIEGGHLHFSLLKKSGKDYVTVDPQKYLK